MGERLLCLGIVWFALTVRTQAAPLEPYIPPVPPTAPNPIDLLLRLVGLTVVTLTVCCLGMLWAKRIGRASTSKANTNHLTLEGTLILERRASLHAIRVDGQRVIVAVDNTGIKSLTPISEPFAETLHAISDSANEPPHPM
jgi:flagellar biogenesis protein FliO